MSACSDFAEHVWKPGSCKNCFHPLSAHKTSGVPYGGVPAAFSHEEAGVTTPSPYSKPTIAVKPTMMSLDTSEPKDVNMNIEQQEKTKSPAEQMGLKKLLNLSPLYIDSCNKAHRDAVLQSPDAYGGRISRESSIISSISRESSIISSIFVSQEESRSCQSFNRNVNDGSFSPIRTKSTYNGGAAAARAHYKDSQETFMEILSSVVPSSPPTLHSNGVGSSGAASSTSSPVVKATGPASVQSVPVLSKQGSLSDSSSSYRSSTDSLPGRDPAPGSPGSPCSAPGSPGRGGGPEPIYAESTKKKNRRPPGTPGTGPGPQSPPGSPDPDPTEQSEVGPGDGSRESPRATISVMAARTEDNNRTFYLSSPDSAVSTRCRFSPTARKEAAGPAFRWPSPSHSAPSLLMEASLSPTLQPKPQSSPPIPPKRTSRSPKLGASALSSSVLSPVSLPDLPVFFLVSTKDSHFKVAGGDRGAAPDPWGKPGPHGSGWTCRIEEEEEEEEREKRRAPAGPGATPPGGAAAWKDARDWRGRGAAPPPVTEPGTAPPAPPAAPDNAACQGGAGAEEEGQQNGSMPAKQPLHGGSSELPVAGKGNSDPNPPPPPPKKLHRGSSKMSGSNAELDRCSHHGSLDSSTSSLRGLGSAGLPAASTDNLAVDAGSRDASRLSCSSPLPRTPGTPGASAPGSPHPPAFSPSSAQPPPLPEKKMVNRTLSAPDSGVRKPFVRAFPRLPFTSSESNVCRSAEAGSRSSLPSSPVDPRGPLFSSNESLERCHALPGRASRSRTLEEPLKAGGRLGVHSRSSLACSSSPQLSAPFAPQEPGSALNLGSSLQLQTLLSNIDSREGVYSKLGGLYAESLRRLALKCEDHFTRSQRNPLKFEESNWSLFRLTSHKPSCSSGDAVYYSAACASDPCNSYAVKICKSLSAEAKQAHLYGLSVQQSIPPHFNLQQDCGHFLACVPQSMLGGAGPGPAPAAPSPPGAEQERVVVIAPDIPQQTAADFVREWEAFHKVQPEVYERRVCFLLLQLCNGLEHLKEHGVTHRDLCLENLLLVPHQRRHSAAADGTAAGDSQRHLPRLLISNFAKAKRRSAEDASSVGVKRDHARLAPEIVSAAQYRKFDEFQTGILIYELLHQPNPFELRPALKEQDYDAADLPPVPSASLYSAGLRRLAQLLLQPDPIKRIHIQEAKRVLQSLLWGPRRDLMEQQWERQAPAPAPGLYHGPRHEGLLNWLDVKRALLMMKFAERSLEPERNAELEDWLCCQYFSSAHPLSLCHTAELLYSLKG